MLATEGREGGPRLLPRYSDRIDARIFTRIVRRGGLRQLVFVPGAVLKFGMTADERRMLAQEGARTSAAANHPFWRGLPAPVFSFFGTGLVCRRYESARMEDFPAIAGIVERLLGDCADLPVRPMVEDIARSTTLVEALGIDDRQRLEDTLGNEALPSSSMHGDLHFFNFVRSKQGLMIIDWEDFDGVGSFVFDYIDFHVAIDQLNGARHWPTTLGDLSLDHPALQRAAEVSRTTPRALRAYFLMRKVATILKRRREMRAVDPVEREGLVAALRSAFVSPGHVRRARPASAG